MKIAVLSDTHGNYPLAVRLLDELADLSCIIHLGDCVADAEIIESAISRELIKIRGNCDTDTCCPREMLLDLRGIKTLITHGDLHGVKSGITGLHAKAAAENARLVLYGHSHLPGIQERSGILFVNPGCIRENSPCKSFSVISISDRRISAELFAASEHVVAEPLSGHSVPL
jgi:putative phosphoesterase